jgi:DNA polymerase-3 subunit epsilon
MQIVFYDLETTIPASHILEFGCVVVDSETFEEIESFETLIYSGRITPWSMGCNGITPEMVAGAPRIDQVIDVMYAYLHDRIWAGHNIQGFDNPIIHRTFTSLSIEPPQPAGVIDTLPLARKHLAGQVANHKLETLAEHFNLGPEDHRSLSDARMCCDVLKCMNLRHLPKQYAEGMISSNITGDAR